LGKTQTAVEFCYRYGRYFYGGVFWLSFAQAENVAEEVALIGSERGLSVYQEAEQLSLADRINRVQRTWQEPIPRLLIFDNCEDDLLLKEWLPTTGGCYILLTSRRAEWPRELNVATLSLQVLRRPDSIRLLQHLAPNVGSDEADEVASEVGDLPLAIHLAGGFLHRYQQVSPSQYLSQLRDKDLLAHPSLQGHGLSHSPTGHALHVARTFALSLEQLSLQDEVDRMAQRLLLHVACFAPGEPLAQKVLRATAVDEADLTATLLMTDSLKRLVALGFLEADGQESVVMHRLLVSFVVKEFGETEMGQARTAVANSLSQQLTPYLHQAFQAGLPPVSPPQLRHMTDTALAHGMATAPWLTLALGRYLREVGEYAAAQSYLERGLQVAGDEGDFYTRGRLLAVLARAYYSQGFHRQAHQQTLEAERLLRLADVPQQQWLIRVLLRRGWAGLRLGQAQPALAAVNEAWQLSIAADDLPTSASCLNLMGSIHFFLLGEYKKAEDYFEQAKVAHQLISDPFGEATFFLILGECANAQGDYQRAKANMQEALRIIRRIGNRMRELSILTSLGEVLVQLGEYETAVTQLTHVITEAPADWTYAPIAYHALAEAYLGRGQVAEALRAVQMADALDPADDPFVAGIGWRVLGQIAAEQGELVVWTSDEIYTAEACFARSLQIFTEIDNQRERAIVLWLWAEYDLAHGDKVHGKQLWPEAQEIFIRLKLPLLIRRMNEEL
jgi:tetratricopeptide (TPR) repeat protein